MHQPPASRTRMLESDQVSLADIRLRAPASWVFYDFAGLVLAQRASRGGSLQISTAFRFDCEGERDPEVSEKLTREFAGDAEVGPFTTETIDPKGDIVGWGDVGKAGSDGRVWYVLRDGQLMLGIFRRNSPGASDDVFTLELHEADAILRSAQWRTEQPGWQARVAGSRGHSDNPVGERTLAATASAAMRDTDSTDRVLARSEHYTVSHEFETVYLDLPSGERVVIGDFYGEPEAAAIDADEQWAVVVGCGLILYRLRPPFEAYEHNTPSDQWWEAHRDPPSQWWIETVYQVSPNAVRFVVDPAADNAGLYQLDVDSLSIDRINLGFESS